MLKSITAMLFVCCLGTVRAQETTVMLSGSLVDAVSQQPLPFINLVLRPATDSTAGVGTFSGDDGRWSIAHIKPGTYVLHASGVGYSALRRPVHIGSLSANLDLGSLLMQPSVQELGTFEVVSRTAQVGDQMDKKVFRMEDQLSQSGGSVLQALRNLPGVTVDQRSGKLQLRGSDKVAVLVDGQQTALTGFGDQSGLDNIPASAIERIEVINDPSAKQDANGMAGIINIIYKKDKREGLHGKASMLVGAGALGIKQADLPTVRPQYGNTPKLGSSLGLNWNKGKTDLYLQADLLSQRVLNRDEHFARTYDNGDVLRQQYLENRDQTMYTVKTGLDLHPNERNDLRFSLLYNREAHIDHGDVVYFDGTLTERQRLWQFHEDEVNTSGQFASSWTHRTKRPGERVEAGLNYTFHREDEVYDINDATPAGPGYNNTALLADEHVADAKLDYVRPLAHGRFETGVKFRWRHIPTRITFAASAQSPLDLGAAGGATYDELIPAVYGNYVYERERYELEAGLRVEYVDLKYNVAPGHNTYSSDGYDYLQPFPNARFAYKLNETSRISVNLSRRVDRPDEGDLRIFPKYDDPGLLRIGNPGLRPQFTWRGELGYKHDITKGYVYVAAYHRITSDILTRIITADTAGTQLYSLAQNAGQGTNSGVELVLEREVVKNLKLGLNANIYHNTVDAFSTVSAYPRPTPYSAQRQQLTSGNVKVNARLLLPRDLSVQLTGIWLARDIVPQGSTAERWSVDAGVNWKVAKTRSELTVNATDLLNTMRMGRTVTGDGFHSVSTDYLETRAVRLTWAWAF
ncbi:MAG: TonB-dependent receptor [Flavobacteriales bacterium]|nr:TonB-dependent receptor [Flavobacteriales bacterium]